MNPALPFDPGGAERRGGPLHAARRLLGSTVMAFGSAGGWLLYVWVLLLLAQAVPADVVTPGTRNFLLLIGAIGMWRYALGFTHFVRGMIFMHWTYPRMRRRALDLGDDWKPSHCYFLVTSFRIDSHTTAAVYRSVLSEAAECGVASTIVASIVELADERLILGLWERLNPPDHVRLRIVRIPGTGKRDGLAQGFRAISRDMPDADAVVAVIDGDTALEPGVIEKTAPYFKLMPNVGGITTNEFCQVDGGYWMSEWHHLRFAQRHINMCSMALSSRVLTLTGRMSLFRATVVTNPEFIHDVENDALDHWRLGRFRFLTGDDKSSWFSLMRLGYDTWYVPDAAIRTMEHPPDPSFLRSSRKLMFRWYGNSLRQNSRATRLGARRLGWFTYYVLWDQRVSMWTSLLGLSAALVGAFKYGAAILVVYALWVGTSRLLLTLMLTASGHRIGPSFPLLLFYNQICGALTKIYVYFHLDQQSWTRQKTTLNRELDGWQRWFNSWSSTAMMCSAASVFAVVVLKIV